MAENTPSPTNNASSSADGGADQNTNTNNNSNVRTAVNNKMAAQTAQLNKMRDANGKYKNLLKMAKERIQQQEEELEQLKREVEAAKENPLGGVDTASSSGTPAITMDDGDLGGDAESSASIVCVLQRVKAQQARNGGEEIWALVEFEEVMPDNLVAEAATMPPNRYRKWKRFEAETELEDFIRRDTGEPLTLPPYSLAPEQSARIQEEAKKEVSQVMEEFRRFRVRSELSRKQQDAHIKELQSNHVQTAQRRIEGQDLDQQLEQARSERGELNKLKAEMAENEANWKEAYDVLLAENNALKSSGSEALLAAQWRQRYETCLEEKETAKAQLQTALHKQTQELEERGKADAGKYEMKYRDLKESFRLYRKKAKEIFESQQNGDVSAQLKTLTDRGSEESKLNYLKNLMNSEKENSRELVLSEAFGGAAAFEVRQERRTSSYNSSHRNTPASVYSL
ncbi:expressed unknown protein [Seminavis robusta]|uniref:Uncharacterized protein n=1 Tax=Seminavis robusta TaxID=568900 RepID=A0A9N8EPL3_9STRA|nr:expressed unknown protein [Seminavis robusta]|eukprot:Sro1458_g274440.1 n/a (455) ;mRNA; f:18807-20567